MKELYIIHDIVTTRFSIENINRNTRAREYVYARYCYCYLAREYTTYSLKQIGRIIKKDHATVLHGIKKVKELLTYKQDKIFEEIFGECNYICSSFFNKQKKKEIERKSLLDLLKIKEDEINLLKGKLITLIKFETLYNFVDLNEDELNEFEDRIKIIHNSIKSRRTYKNTPKSNFNVKTSREMIEL